MAIDYREALEKIDIADVIEKETDQPIKRVGNNTVQTKCPFHGGSDSFFITYKFSEGGHFKCFNGSCGKTGNVIEFLKEYKGLSFQESLLYLRNEYNIDIDVNPKAIKKNKEKIRKNKVIRLVKKYYHWNLLHHKKKDKALRYLKKRGLSMDTIKEHEIGFAPFYDKKFIPYMKSKGVTMEELDDLGLIKEYKDGVHPFFRNRVMFGLYGRSLRKNDNLPHLYSNIHDNLYNFSKIQKADTLVVSESHFDSVSAEQVMRKEYPKTKMAFTTTFGTNGFKRSYAKKLRRRTDVKNIILCYDGDMPGITAMIKDGYMLENEGFKVSIARVPFGQDINKLLELEQQNLISKTINSADITPIELEVKMLIKKYMINQKNGRKNIAINELSNILDNIVPKIDKKLFDKGIKGYMLKRPLVAKIIVDSLFEEVSLSEETKNNLKSYYEETISKILKNKLYKSIKEG